MASNNATRPQFDVVHARTNIISEGTATRTLKVEESGSMCLFDRAAGVVYTLPAACPIGTTFEFMTAVTITSNAAKVITGAGTELMVGAIVNTDTDTSNATIQFPSLVGSSNIAVSMNGSTTGGIIGDYIRMTKVTSTKWSVTGHTLGTGTVATPFSAS
jgi:hypothetical protein